MKKIYSIFLYIKRWLSTTSPKDIRVLNFTFEQLIVHEYLIKERDYILTSIMGLFELAKRISIRLEYAIEEQKNLLLKNKSIKVMMKNFLKIV